MKLCKCPYNIGQQCSGNSEPIYREDNEINWHCVNSPCAYVAQLNDSNRQRRSLKSIDSGVKTLIGFMEQITNLVDNIDTNVAS